MADILIKNGHVITMDSHRKVIERGSVAIKDGKITAVGDKVREKADVVINAKGKVVMPGLVNAHTHLAMTLLRGVADDMELMPWLETKIWPLERKLTGKRVYAGSLLGCLEMIKSGTTCFADMYFFMEDVARAVEKSGMRGVLSYGMIEKGDPTLRNSETKKGTEFVKKYHGRADGRILTMFGPHAPYTCSVECLLKVKELAKKHGVGIHIHLAESDDDVKNTTAFQSERPVKLLDKIGFLGPEVLAAHCVKVNEDEIGMLRNNHVKVAHNPVSNLKLASGMAPVARYLKEGIVVGLGTDGAASNNSLDMFEEMKVCSLMAKVRESSPTVVSAGEALEMATIGGARALRLEKEVGSISVGKKADVIIVDLKQPHLTPLHNVVSHLVYAARGGDVSTTIVDGKILMRERKVLTLDEDKIMKDAQDISDELIAEGGRSR